MHGGHLPAAVGVGESSLAGLRSRDVGVYPRVGVLRFGCGSPGRYVGQCVVIGNLRSRADRT